MVDDFRSPVAALDDLAVAGPGTGVQDQLAQIDLMKMRLLTLHGLGDGERQELLGGLDVLRAGYVRMANVMSPAQPVNVDSSFEEDILRPRLEGAAAKLELHGILGQNTRIVRNLEHIAKVAPTDLTVLLEGETGSGKELFAQIIHANSPRDRIISVNCGAFPSDLIEAELFGHVKGAFTGATSHRRGKFEEADGGTIFLDEIGDLELRAQVKLLRVLDIGEIQRVGSDVPQKVNVRIIAATNVNLERMVREGKFREDLYYRLNVCQFFIPPLRERRDEIEILYEFFVKQVAENTGRPLPVLAAETRNFLFEEYGFPGNIRELKNLSRYLAQIYDGRPLGVMDLPDRYRRHYEVSHGPTATREQGLHRSVREHAERSYLSGLLTQYGGDVRQLQSHLKLSRSRIYQMLKKHDLRPAEFKPNG